MMKSIKRASYATCLGAAVLMGSAMMGYPANAMPNLSDSPKATIQDTATVQKIDYYDWRWRHHHRYWRDHYYWRHHHHHHRYWRDGRWWWDYD